MYNFFQKKYDNGNIFIGSVKSRQVNGKNEVIREGFGVMIYKDGTKYQGEFINDKVEGYGLYYNKEGRLVYEGYWKNGKRNGIGIYHAEDGSIFKGEWANNIKNGVGIFEFGDKLDES